MNLELQKQFNARELTAIRKYLRLRRAAQRINAKQKAEQSKKPILATIIHSKIRCSCGLLPSHEIFEHDNCCQICGGSHSERICPKKEVE